MYVKKSEVPVLAAALDAVFKDLESDEGSIEVTYSEFKVLRRIRTRCDEKEEGQTNESD